MAGPNSKKETKVIEKKILPEYFQAILEGKKTFEVRLGNLECKPGDILVLKEWDDRNKRYTGRELKRRITYVLNTKDLKFWKEEEIKKYGLKIIGLEYKD